MRRLVLPLLLLAFACREAPAPTRPEAPPPSMLLITLDTTRADSIGPEARGIETPAFNALAARGRRFRFAYATTPQTLPSHSSMMTGLYPAGHGVHENGRYLPADRRLVAEELKDRGYRTGAFVSAFALARRFGLARGFDVYDDDFGPGRAQRNAAETTERALEFLNRGSDQPLFLWVHYYDPHYPYEPPEPFLSRHPGEPYLGEIAFMDEQMGRLVAAFEQRITGPGAILVLADHGEGLGDHGEQQHGNLLYQPMMLVPFVAVGPGIEPGIDETPVSVRRVHDILRRWAGLTSDMPATEVVLGEAMKPFLDYGWRPQVMAVDGRLKAILAGRLEVYDVVADPAESRDLGENAELSRPLRAALREYPIPNPAAAAPPSAATDEERKKLASLGYVAATAPPVVRPDAPRPADMTHLFPILDLASGFFVRERYAEALPLLEQIRQKDPNNLDAALRLAVAHSALGHNAEALAAFRRAQALAPESRDVRAYLALHYAKTADWPKAEPLLEQVLREEPDRLPAIEALAVVRERQQRIAEAVELRKRVYAVRAPTGAELARLGALQMSLGQTGPAIASLEQARDMQGTAFTHHLELGVLYLASRRLEDARAALDRVPSSHPEYPMALFKRAQVSVLLGEPDRAARIAAARRHADAATRELIARETLFR